MIPWVNKVSILFYSIIHGIWGRILSFLASITGYPTDAINVLLNFGITIVGDLFHQIDSLKIQQTEKKV